MKACLLYAQREWSGEERYFDEKAIVQDLGLDTLFRAAASEVVLEEGKVKCIGKPDPDLEDAMRKVTLVPLKTEEEILYRQEILRDCHELEDLIYGLYEFSGKVLADWDKLGRRAAGRAGTRNSPGNLMTEIRVLRLFVTSLSRLKELLGEYRTKFRSKGFISLYERLRKEFSHELEQGLTRILEGISFYASDKERDQETFWETKGNKPRIVLGCSMGEGLKLKDFGLEEVETDVKRCHRPASLIRRAQDYISEKTKTLVCIQRETGLWEQAEQLEYSTVRYIVSCCDPFFSAFNGFFRQLRFQAAFYRGAVNLKHHLERFGLPMCYPRVGGRETLCFRMLKEPVMAVEQHLEPVGNTCDMAGKKLLIITGANQGGKSTFLRSIGIAQVMMQAGLTVSAESYESGIFTSFFTHFTRREDSAMNSGRLDEELGRMSRIVDHLGEDSLVLLNESFASTTELEGSVIAYDIVRALMEAGVKVLTVTHLLSFARRMYDQFRESPDSGVEFYSAQRMEDGTRTFRMVRHAPELTSFGLDLYDEMIGKDR